MSDQTGVVEVYMNVAPRDDLPIGELYQQRDEADLIERQRQQVPVEVDTSQGGLNKAASGAAKMPAPPKPNPPDPKVIEQINAGLSNLDVRGAVDSVSRGLFGMSVDQWQDAIENGTLPQQVSKIVSVSSNAAERAARDAAVKANLDPANTEMVVGITGLLAGIIVPAGPGGKAGKAGKAGGLASKMVKTEEELAAGARAAERAAQGLGPNIKNVDATVEVKSTMRAINELQTAKLEKARQTVTHGQTIEESQRLGLTLEQATKLDVEKYDLRPVQQAVRDYYAAASTHVDDLFRRALKGDEDAAVALNYAIAPAGDLAVRDEMLGKVAARSLEARKIKSLADRTPFTPEAMKDLSERMAGGLPQNRDELIERGKTLAARLDVLSKAERAEFMRHAVGEAQKGKSNVLYEAWMNWGLLSGPQTHMANVTSNALTTLWAPGERMLSASADYVQTVGGLAGPRNVYMGESAAMMFAIPNAFRDAVMLAGKSLKTGAGVFGPEKVERGADAARRIMMQSDDTLGHATGFFGAAFRAPTRALTAEDSFFKVINYRMELYAQAYREAASQNLSGKAFASKVREIIDNPPDAVAARAQQFALAQTFNQELSDIGRVGQFAQGASTMMDALPGGRLIMPFVRTPANIMHYASERTPFLNAFSDTIRKDILAGGARRAEAIGKISGGAMLGAVVMNYAASGLIVGGGPSDPAEREQWMAQDGRKPYSIRLGDEWVTYGRLDPLGLMMGTVADAMDIMSRLPDGHPLRAEIAAGLATAFAKNMVSKTYLQGVSDLFSAFSGDKTVGQNLTQIPKGLARSMTPSIVRTAERTAFDPERSETRVPRQVYNEATGKFENDPFAEVQEWLNEMKAGIPGLSKDLPPVRNRFGEVVNVPPGFSIDIPGFDVPGGQTAMNMLSPMYSSQVKEDDVSREVARLRIGFKKPQPVVFGKIPPELQMTGGRESDYGVELNPKEADRLYVLAGQGVEGAPTFREALATMMRNAGYQQLGDAGKRLLLQQVDVKYKEAARAQLLKESPGLLDLIEMKLRDRANAIKPGAGGPPRVPAPAGGAGLGPGLVIPRR